jgi:hypothetical protein
MRKCRTRRSAAFIVTVGLVGASVAACSDGGSGSAPSSASSTEGGRRARLIAPAGLRAVLDPTAAERLATIGNQPGYALQAG